MMISCLVLIVLIAMMSLNGVDCNQNEFTIKVFDVMNKNLDDDTNIMNEFNHQMKQYGIVGLKVNDKNDFLKIKNNVFSSIAKCVKVVDNGYHVSTFNDGTKRKSFASYVAADKRRRLVDLDESLCELSDDIAKNIETLQHIVDDVSLSFARMLDKYTSSLSSSPLFKSKNQKKDYESFYEIVLNGDHLDHLHVYEKNNNEDENGSPTLDFHTDQGLFVAIIPALEVEFNDGIPVAKRENEVGIFEIELKNGDKVKVKLPSNDEDIIIFMIGEGSNFINKERNVDLRAVPHALTMLSSENISRVWFGRMFFPPSDALLGVDEEATFQTAKYHGMMQYKNSENHVSNGLGCSSSSKNDESNRILVDVAQGESCKSDEIYCWMSCQSTTNLGCAPKFAKCINKSNGNVWDNKSHCSTCEPKCNKCSKATCTKLKTSAQCKSFTACCKWSAGKCVLK